MTILVSGRNMTQRRIMIILSYSHMLILFASVDGGIFFTIQEAH